MRPQKLTEIQSNQFKNQSDIICRTYLKGTTEKTEPLARRSQKNGKTEKKDIFHPIIQISLATPN